MLPGLQLKKVIVSIGHGEVDSRLIRVSRPVFQLNRQYIIINNISKYVIKLCMGKNEYVSFLLHFILLVLGRDNLN